MEERRLLLPLVAPLARLMSCIDGVTMSAPVGSFVSPEKVIEAALDQAQNIQAPIEREDMVLELDKLVIRKGIFREIMKKKEPEEGEEDIYYTVYFPVADHKECGQQLSEIFLSERECVSDASKQNRFKHSSLNK
jgi:hypothetical protein